jgi:hypothetical protein
MKAGGATSDAEKNAKRTVRDCDAVLSGDVFRGNLQGVEPDQAGATRARNERFRSWAARHVTARHYGA